MKKLKEFLYFLISFVILTVLQITVYILSPFVAGSHRAFIGPVQYLRLFLSDETFLRAVINTFRIPFISSVVLIALSFSVLKGRLKFSRKNFYLTSFLASAVIAVIYFAFNVAFNNILGYIFYPLQVGLFCAFTFWIVELILDLFKLLKTNIR